MKSVLKKFIPRNLVLLVRSLLSKIQRYFVVVGSISKPLARIYYLFSTGFSNEHVAVLRGRRQYYKSLKYIGQSCALLRRNTHRLEKGLIMRPRREVFAKDFILETVECYKQAVMSDSIAADELKWATDVLDEYFSIVGSSKEIDKAKALYLKIKHADELKRADIALIDQQFKPYPQEILPQSNISIDELSNLFVRRRSVRWYKQDHVPLDLVQKAANLASLAPSACNRQPYRFVFCNNKEKAVAIAKCAGGTGGFAENLPAIIVIVGDLSSYPYERDRHLIYIDGSLAAMQMMLALETLGLSTCSINWPEVDSSERKIRKIINLKDYERVVMLMAVGYADEQGGIPYSQKKINGLILEDIS